MPQTERIEHLQLGNGYETDPIREYAETFGNTVQNIVNESRIDFYRNTDQVLNDRGALSTLKKFFVENSFDQTNMRPSEIQYQNEQVEQLFENDIKAMNEAAALNTFNPLIGMALPMHKNIMMNMVWDKGGIPKVTAPSQKFTRTMETRLLIDPDGNKIDMWLEQNKLTKAMQSVNPWRKHRFVKANAGTGQTLMSEAASFDFIASIRGDKAKKIEHLDVETHISAVAFDNVFIPEGGVLPDENGFIPDEVTDETPVAEAGGETVTLWVPVKAKFAPGYGEIKRQLMHPVSMTALQKTGTSDPAEVILHDTLVANIENDRINLTTMGGVISGIEVSYKLDASSRTLPTATVSWEETTTLVEIGTDVGISTTISPEEIKDVSILYNMNQLTKYMSLMKTVLANRKDDQIKEGMDISYHRLPESQRFFGIYDFASRDTYMGDYIEWRQKTFWDWFDQQITQMFRILNDPNMTVSVYGEPDIIRRLTPKQYSYQAPSQIGPVELDFSKTVCNTSDKRVYSFVGSDKLRTADEPELIITLCPRNSMRIVYVIYDYQFYISNEIRNNDNPALPNVLAFERWLFDEYQPVQGRVKIANPSGLRPEETESKSFQVYTGF